MRAALVNIASGIVENVIIVGPDYEAPDAYLIVGSDTANIGDVYSDGVFTPPEQSEQEQPA